MFDTLSVQQPPRAEEVKVALRADWKVLQVVEMSLGGCSWRQELDRYTMPTSIVGIANRRLCC